MPDLADLLDDLQHDLGRHARLPLVMLGPDATPQQVHEALTRGLQRTQQGPQGTRSAAELWQEFDRALPGPARAQPWFARLHQAVQKALAWQPADPAQVGAAQVDRTAALADLQAMTDAIRQARREVADAD